MRHDTLQTVVTMFRFNTNKAHGKEDFEKCRRKNLELWKSGESVRSASDFPEVHNGSEEHYVIWVQQYQAKGRMGITVIYLHMQNSKHQQGDYSWLTKI